jgi:uncharacterized protein involved in exopolysaccharide biosynthesis
MDQSFAGYKPPASSPQPALEPLRAHLAFIVVFVVSATASALALTYIYSEQYQAEATILFKPQSYMRLNEQQTEALGSPVPTTPFKVIGQTLSGLAKSDAVLQPVVTELRLDVLDPKDYSGPWYVSWYRRVKDFVIDVGGDAWSMLKYGRIIEEDPVAQAVRNLKKNIKVEHEDSYVFTIRAIDKKPKVVAAIADTLAGRLTDLLRSADQAPALKRREELEGLLTSKAANIRDLEGRMHDLLASHHLGSLMPEIENGTSRFSQLEFSRAQVEAELRQEEERLGGLTSKLGAIDETATNTRVWDALSRLGQNYPKFTTEKLTAEVNVGALYEKRASIEKSIGKLRAHLQLLSEIQIGYNQMATELDAAKRDYTILAGAVQEAIIRQTTAQNELRIQDKAQVPELPRSPIKIYHVGLAAFLAAIVAVGLAYVFDYFGIDFFANRRSNVTTRKADADIPYDLG